MDRPSHRRQGFQSLRSCRSELTRLFCRFRRCFRRNTSSCRQMTAPRLTPFPLISSPCNKGNHLLRRKGAVLTESTSFPQPPTMRCRDVSVGGSRVLALLPGISSHSSVIGVFRGAAVTGDSQGAREAHFWDAGASCLALASRCDQANTGHRQAGRACPGRGLANILLPTSRRLAGDSPPLWVQPTETGWAARTPLAARRPQVGASPPG
ncbi:hypothetical protein MYIN104542_18795 [Mycobacterium intermedium]